MEKDPESQTSIIIFNLILHRQYQFYQILERFEIKHGPQNTTKSLQLTTLYKCY